MDVDRAALQRLLAERLHAIDQRADAVGLVADQHGKLAVGLGHRASPATAPPRVCRIAGSSPRAPGSPPCPRPMRAALRKLSWRSSARAAEPSWKGQQHAARLLRQRGALHGDAAACRRGLSKLSRAPAPSRRRRAPARSAAKMGLSAGQQVAQRQIASIAAARGRRTARPRGWRTETVGAVEQHAGDRQRGQQRQAASARARGASRPPTTRSARARLRAGEASACGAAPPIRAAPRPCATAGSTSGSNNAPIAAMHLAGIGQAHDCGAELRRAGQAARVPGDMLAGEAQPGIGCRNAPASNRNGSAGSLLGRAVRVRAAACQCRRNAATCAGNQGRP